MKLSSRTSQLTCLALVWWSVGQLPELSAGNWLQFPGPQLQRCLNRNRAD